MDVSAFVNLFYFILRWLQDSTATDNSTAIPEVDDEDNDGIDSSTSTKEELSVCEIVRMCFDHTISDGNRKQKFYLNKMSVNKLLIYLYFFFFFFFSEHRRASLSFPGNVR